MDYGFGSGTINDFSSNRMELDKNSNYGITILVFIIISVIVIGCCSMLHLDTTIYNILTCQKKKETVLDIVVLPICETGCVLPSDCSICIDKMDDTTKNTGLECEHYFHTDCIIEWIKCNIKNNGNVHCPLCRNEVKIIVKNIKVFSNSQPQLELNQEPQPQL